MELTAGNLAGEVERVFKDCLFTDAEIPDGKPPEGAVIVEAIMMAVGFHPGRLEFHRAEVIEFLRMLPDGFFKGTGDGWSFLNLPMTKTEEQWGEHRNAEQLMSLAFALKLGNYTLPRSMWKLLPGGMPYIAFEALPA